MSRPLDSMVERSQGRLIQTKEEDGFRPLPYALGAADRFVAEVLQVLYDLIKN